ncbi:MAG: hypothetical protein JWN08_3835 [Frankiales bacterium]|nr:hypothetical protein [Frankiales bacterium]
MTAAQAQVDAGALQRFLDAVEPSGGVRVTAVTPLTGGYSRDTAIGEVTWRDGRQQRLVLRSDPPPGSGVFQSDRDDEWELLQALVATGPVQVPAARWYDATGAYFGCKTIVSEYYEASRTLQDLARDAELEGDLGAVQRRFVDVVVDIHRTPLADLPARLSRPADWDSYVDSLFDVLSEVAEATADSSPAIRYTVAQLRRLRPPPVPLTLVHGDCQPGNVLLGDAGPVVIDWEFGRIGDPREDLGYYVQMPILPNLYTCDPEAFLARYRELTGMTEEQLNPQVAQYFLVLGMARLFAQEIHGADAVARGRAPGVMATYLVNAISMQYENYVRIARELSTSPGPGWTQRASAPAGRDNR